MQEPRDQQGHHPPVTLKQCVTLRNVFPVLLIENFFYLLGEQNIEMPLKEVS
jgi:hypothetical protein